MTYIPRKVHNTFMCNKLSLVLFASCETSSSEKLSKMCSSRPLYCGIEPNMPECEAKIGQIMPDFKGKTLEGNINLHDWLGDSWGVVFTLSGAFGPICTTELGALAKRTDVSNKT